MKTSSFLTSLRVFGWLLWADVRFIWKDFVPNLIDAFTWPGFIIIVNGFIMPAMGMPANYGPFTSVGMVIMMGCYTAWAVGSLLAMDISGPQTISYELTLPLPYWMVWIKNGIYFSIKATAFNLAPLLIGKLCFYDQFDFSNFSLPKFLMIYTLSGLLFGMFALWSTVITKTAEGHSRLELRLIGPMFYLNGFSSPWIAMFALSPVLGYFVRCLPWIYAYDGLRATIFGQAGFINIWVCAGMLLFFVVLIAAMSTRLFKKRMDCV